MLAHGLGRAVLFLENATDTTIYRETVWAACCEDWRHCRQTEDDREIYLFDVVHATGEPEWYRDRVATALDTLGTPSEPELISQPQIIGIACLFTQNGDQDLRESIYQALKRIPCTDLPFHHYGPLLIAMDGIEGFRFLLTLLLGLPEPDEDSWDEISLMDTLFEQLGEQSAKRSLSQLAETHPALAPHLVRIRKAQIQRQKENEEERQKRSHTPPIPIPPTEADIRAYLGSSSKNRPRRPRMYWATSDTIAQLVHELSHETNRERQMRYLELLRSYNKTPFPGNPEILLRLICQTDDNRLAWYATRVLKYTTAPIVRAAALELLQTEQRRYEGATLLVFNPGDRDTTLFASLIAQNSDADTMHFLGMAIRDYAKRQFDTTLIPVLLACYEKTPCSFCRYGLVELLHEHKVLPPAFYAECRYDAASDTRELVVELSP